MLRMAVLDDNDDKRNTVIRGLNIELKGHNWECVECPLALDIVSYTSWICRENIAVLLVDQLLNEQPLKHGNHVDYKGHEVVAEIRKSIPNFPIVIITRAVEDPDLQPHLGEADYVIGRSDLLKDPEKHVPRLVRCGQKYIEAHAKELAELTRLSTKIASGNCEKGDYEQLAALQQKMALAFASTTASDRLLDDLQVNVEKLETLAQKLKQFLNRGTKE